MATELEQLQALTLQVQQLTCAMMDMDKRHVQGIQQRDLQLAEMRRTLTALNTRIEVESEPVRVAGRKDPPQDATLRRTSDVMENLRVRMESLPHRTGQEVSRAPGENRRPHQGCSQRRPEPQNQELSVQLYFAPVLLMPRESVGELTARNVNQGEGARKRSRHVVQNGRSPVPSGLSTYEKIREEVMSALTAELAVHEPMGDDPMEIGAVGKSGKKGTGKKGKGKNDQKGREKGPGQGKGSGTQNPHADRECFYCREGQQVQGRERQETGQPVPAKGRETSECDEWSRTREPRNEQQQHQSRRGPGHGRRVASTHDLRGQNHAWLDREFQ